MKANELIKRLEEETGQRIDDDNSMAMAGLSGAMNRMMGQSPPAHTEKDDVAAGLLTLHQRTPEYKNEQESRRILGDLLAGEMSPDEMKKSLG